MKKYFGTLVFLIAINAVFAQLPLFEWAKAFEKQDQFNPSGSGNGRSIDVDQMGNVYSAGLFVNTVDFDPGPGIFPLTAANFSKTAIYISKLNPSGEFIWAIQIPALVEWNNIEIRVDRNNNVYIVSELKDTTDFDPGPEIFTLNPIGVADAFVAKYDPNGKLVWAKHFGGPGGTIAACDALEIDNNNNVIIGGYFNNTIDFDPGSGVQNITSTAHTQAYIVKLNSEGSFIWAKQFGNSPVVNLSSNIGNIQCDKQGNIYLTGDFTGNCDFDPGPSEFIMQSNGLNNGFVVKLSNNSNLIWAKNIEGTNLDRNPNISNRGIAIDFYHNVYLAGSFLGAFDFDPGVNKKIITSNNYDWFILKLNQQGAFEWVDVFSGSEHEIGADLSVGSDSNIYSIGTILGTVDMDPGSGVRYVSSVTTAHEASTIVKVNPKGELLGVGTIDQIGSEYGNCFTRRMEMDYQNNIYITGYTVGMVDFDPGQGVFPLDRDGIQAPYVLKLSKCKGITTSTLNINSCNSFILNNETFDSTGTYIRTLINSTGCDSIITLQLTITKKFSEQSKTICMGESFFAAGANQTNSGVYIDTFKSSLNCDSVVTTKLTVNPAPIPNLGPDRNLCEGTEAIINPGSFTKYIWHDMSTFNTNSINSTGIYWVKVTNEYNCSATDTLIIKSMLLAPGNFLKNTDSVCRYQKISISSSKPFSQYLWSNGDNENMTTVNTPGTYWLKVTDSNGCVGNDSISIMQKECMQGVYIPNAFTPNNDGLNDLFKASIYGNIKSFNLQVFNRYGQLVFQTNDYSKGWNGTFKGLNVETSTFAWSCSYQIENRQPEHQKGTVTIIR